jgi:hypothetical protein
MRCPDCLKPLIFDGEDEAYHCEFCDEKFAPEYIENEKCSEKSQQHYCS